MTGFLQFLQQSKTSISRFDEFDRKLASIEGKMRAGCAFLQHLKKARIKIAGAVSCLNLLGDLFFFSNEAVILIPDLREISLQSLKRILEQSQVKLNSKKAISEKSHSLIISPRAKHHLLQAFVKIAKVEELLKMLMQVLSLIPTADISKYCYG